MPYTDDPIADFERHDAEQQRKMDLLPVCAECDEHIQEEELFDVQGELYCWHCAVKLFVRCADNYISGEYY